MKYVLICNGKPLVVTETRQEIEKLARLVSNHNPQIKILRGPTIDD